MREFRYDYEMGNGATLAGAFKNIEGRIIERLNGGWELQGGCDTSHVDCGFVVIQALVKFTDKKTKG